VRIYKELEVLGFFKWYCTQYGGLNYQEYKPVYDDLPLDNLIRTKLNACAFKFFRDKYGLYSVVASYFGGAVFGIEDKNKNYHNKLKFKTHEEAELECIKKLIEITK